MKIRVFGATGAIGSLTVAELLDRGHDVTAYARNRAKIPASWGDRVQVVIGEMSDAQAIDTATSPRPPTTCSSAFGSTRSPSA